MNVTDSGSEQGQVTGSCIGSNESSGTTNPLNAELNPIRHLLALVGARHIVHVSRIRVKC